MRKLSAYLIVLIVLGFIISVPAHAQEATSKIDVFGGFSFLRNNYTYDNGSYTIKGYHFSGTYNLTNHLGFMADISGHSDTSDQNGSYTCCGYYMEKYHLNLKQNMKTFAFGPSFATESGKMRLSAHILAGFSKGDVTAMSDGTQSYDNGTTWTPYTNDPRTILPNTGLAVVLGGSADYMFKPKFGWRILQLDYVHSVMQQCETKTVAVNNNYTTTPDTGCDWPVNDVRLSTGIVFRFGAK